MWTLQYKLVIFPCTELQLSWIIPWSSSDSCTISFILHPIQAACAKQPLPYYAQGRPIYLRQLSLSPWSFKVVEVPPFCRFHCGSQFDYGQPIGMKGSFQNPGELHGSDQWKSLSLLLATFCCLSAPWTKCSFTWECWIIGCSLWASRKTKELEDSLVPIEKNSPWKWVFMSPRSSNHASVTEECLIITQCSSWKTRSQQFL